MPGRDWFGALAEWSVLGSDAVSELRERAFAILPDAVPTGEMERLAAAYDAEMASATGDDIRIGSTSTRVTDFVNRGDEWHVDVGRQSAEWPLAGFILMVDDFRPDNGATRFVPGSHRWSRAPWDSMTDVAAEHDEQVLACGSAGPCWSSTGRPGMATRRRVERAAAVPPGRVHSAGRARGDPTSPPVCVRSRVNGSARSRGTCLR